MDAHFAAVGFTKLTIRFLQNHRGASTKHFSIKRNQM